MTEYLREHRFSELIQDVRMEMQVIQIGDKTLFLWVGTSAARFDNLDLAAPTTVDSLPSGIALMGASTDDVGQAIAKRLAQRLQGQVFVSYNLPSGQPMLQETAERFIIEKLRALEIIKPRPGGAAAAGGGGAAAVIEVSASS